MYSRLKFMLPFIFGAILVSLYGQITITKNDLPAIGTITQMEVDTSGVNVAGLTSAFGTDQTWNSTQELKNGLKYDFKILNLDSTASGARFKDATYAAMTHINHIRITPYSLFGITFPDTTINILSQPVQFEKIEDTQVLGLGMELSIPSIISAAIRFSKPAVIMPLPLEKGKSWSYVTQMDTSKSFSGFNIPITLLESANVTVDGIGNLTLASGTYPCLRLKYIWSRKFFYTLFAKTEITDWSDTRIIYRWITGGIGTVLEVVSQKNETNPMFTNASQVSRMIPTIARMLALVSPNGGENWQASSIQTIRWNSQKVDSVKLEYSADGVSWTDIQTSIPASIGQISWTLPDVTSQNCLVRVSDVSQSGISDASDAVFSIFQKTLALSSPNGGENWEAGTVQTIQWNAQNVNAVKLDYSTDQGVSWTTIQSSLPSSPNQYAWTLPDIVSQQCLVRVSDVSQTGISDAGDAVFSIFKKTLALVSPNGGENWLAGSVQTIQWNSQNIASVKLDYSTDQGVSWTTIQSSLPSSPNQYVWTLPDVVSQQCLVRVSDVSQAGISDASDAVFSIFKKTLALLSPNGGENWRAESVQTIRWSSRNVDQVKLRYSTNLGKSWSTIQLSLAASLGQYTWTVPNANSLNCLVRISDVSQADILDQSDNPFTIFKPALTLVSPNGSENWQAGTVQSIQWNAQNIDAVKLEYSLNQGVSWTLIQSTLSVSPNQYSWTVPDTFSQQCLVRVSEASQTGLSDVSNAIFSIFKKTLALLSPNGGENWESGTVQTIQWNAQNIAAVKLEYSTDQGVNWTTIQSNRPSSPNQYVWTLPDVVSQQCLVRVSDVSQADISDVNDAVFSIFKKTLALVSPNGGENWQAGSVQTIQWSAQNVNAVKLDYSTDQGVSWTTIQSSLPSLPNQYVWTLPDIVSQQCLIRVSDVSQAGISDVSDAVFSIFKKMLALISPNGGESWQAGGIQTIRWDSQNVDSVKMEYASNPDGPWTTIRSSFPASNNRYNWRIPDLNSQSLLIRIVDVSNPELADSSDAVFSIFKKTLTLVSPNGGENWLAGSVQTIQWNAQNIAAVKLEYSTDQGVNWTTIQSNLPSLPNQYGWTLPDVVSQQCLVRISDVSQAGISDVSDAIFSIFKKTLVLVSPNGSENLQAGDTIQVRWESVGINKVHLLISYNPGASWDTLAVSIPSNGEYDWIIPNVNTKQGMIRIEDAMDRSLFAQNATTFTINPATPSAVDGSQPYPDHFGLSRNYPNPFNPVTHLRFDLPEASLVRIGIYDTNGKMIRTLKTERVSAGSHEIEWDGKNDAGEWVPSGVYFARMFTNGETFTRKMVFIK